MIKITNAIYWNINAIIWYEFDVQHVNNCMLKTKNRTMSYVAVKATKLFVVTNYVIHHAIQHHIMCAVYLYIYTCLYICLCFVIFKTIVCMYAECILLIYMIAFEISWLKRANIYCVVISGSHKHNIFKRCIMILYIIYIIYHLR